MDTSLALLLSLCSLWGLLEGWLILRDRARGKGTTTGDSRTRYYNILSMTLSPIAAAVMTAIPGVNALGIRSAWVFGAGVGVMSLGLGLRIWSIAVLGKYFRTTIELEADQKVIQTGPYRLIRHPSYAGLILTCIGYGAALQNAVSFAVVVTFPALALIHRIKIEEDAMAAGMGATYRAYQAGTKRLIPGIW
jgi:protein-S-isoprenylcysteine O-methyltransferase Ste14